MDDELEGIREEEVHHARKNVELKRAVGAVIQIRDQLAEKETSEQGGWEARKRSQKRSLRDNLEMTKGHPRSTGVFRRRLQSM